MFNINLFHYPPPYQRKIRYYQQRKKNLFFVLEQSLLEYHIDFAYTENLENLLNTGKISKIQYLKASC